MNICEDCSTDGAQKREEFFSNYRPMVKKRTISPEDYQPMISDRSNVNKTIPLMDTIEIYVPDSFLRTMLSKNLLLWHWKVWLDRL